MGKGERMMGENIQKDLVKIVYNRNHALD